jgi:predicted ATPase
MLRTLAIANYRSLRDIVVPLSRLTVVTGPNGSGKSSLYRALRLLAQSASGDLVAALAREGGLPSTLWAGPETISRKMKSGQQPVQGGPRQDAVRLLLGFASDDFGYAIDLGLPARTRSAFVLDPEIKRECIWTGPVLRPSGQLIDRRGPALRASDQDGVMQVIPQPLPTFASMMTEFSDPRGAPEMIAVRDKIRSWRFYDHFRTDSDAPARLARIGTHTPVLGDDGRDIAAALQTIREIGDADGLDETIDDAFPGSSVAIDVSNGRFEMTMKQQGLLRPLGASELSDGTLRFLLLAAALLSPRPPELLVLNEPETSLHPDIIPALARLITRAALSSQVVVVSHNRTLVEALQAGTDHATIMLEKVLGETQVVGMRSLDRPAWQWPPR